MACIVLFFMVWFRWFLRFSFFFWIWCEGGEILCYSFVLGGGL